MVTILELKVDLWKFLKMYMENIFEGGASSFVQSRTRRLMIWVPISVALGWKIGNVKEQNLLHKWSIQTNWYNESP